MTDRLKPSPEEVKLSASFRELLSGYRPHMHNQTQETSLGRRRCTVYAKKGGRVPNVGFTFSYDPRGECTRDFYIAFHDARDGEHFFLEASPRYGAGNIAQIDRALWSGDCLRLNTYAHVISQAVADAYEISVRFAVSVADPQGLWWFAAGYTITKNERGHQLAERVFTPSNK